MKRTVPLHEFMPYGAPDLLVARRPDLSRALVISSFMVSGFLLSWGSFVGPLTPVQKAVDLCCDPTHQIAQKFVSRPERPTANRSVVRPSPPKTGFFEPVKEAPPAEPDRLIDYDGLARQVRPGTGDVTDSPPSGPAIVSVDPDKPVDYVEVLPVAVTEVMPEYPEIARQAMVDGRVIILVLVGRDGRVREAKVDAKRSVPMLDQAALDAASRWVFSPALVNNRPVSVWTAIPFRFTLQ